MAHAGWMEYRYTIAACECIPAKLLLEKITKQIYRHRYRFNNKYEYLGFKASGGKRCTYTRMTYNYQCSKYFNQFRDMTAIHTTHKKIPIFFGP